MRRVLVLVVVLTFLAAACQDSASRDELLVVVDGDGSVAVIHADGSVVTEVTVTDSQRHFQPIWVDEDTILFATTESGSNRVSAINLDGVELWSVGYPAPVFFALPSPDGSQVATLRSSTDGSPIVAELWSDAEGVQRIGNEAPFYLAWSPDGQELAAHIGISRLAILVPDMTVVEAATGLYQAPYWSPDGLIGIRTVRGDQRFAVWNGTDPTDIALVRGPVRFVGAGKTIAIATETGSTLGERAAAHSLPRVPQGGVSILNIRDGSVTEVSELPTALFQWDRRGEKLLFATITDGPTPQLQWHVWQDGEIDDHATFAPVPSWVAEFVPFFDQYAQTTNLWSPSGDAFAYPAMVNGSATIILQRLDESEPIEVSSGTWLSWSP